MIWITKQFKPFTKYTFSTQTNEGFKRYSSKGIFFEAIFCVWLAIERRKEDAR